MTPMNQKGWIYRNNVASLSEEFFCFNKAKEQQIIWYHEIKQIRLLTKKDKTRSGMLITIAVVLLNVLYFWNPYSGSLQFLLTMSASASFLVGFWNPFTEVRVRIYYKNQAAEEIVVDKKKYSKYLEVVNLVEKTLKTHEHRLSNQLVMHDWSLSAV
jgi:hypothetical protein